jgi:hypothetical protein
MPELVSTFCGAFALLGVKLLFYSAQPVSFGSVLLTACVAAALAQLLSGTGEIGMGIFGQYLDGAINAACAGAPPGGPVAIVCAVAGADSTID